MPLGRQQGGAANTMDAAQSLTGCSTDTWVARVADVPLRSIHVRIERKHLTLDLKENSRGRFLRITEEVNGRRNTVIVPATGLELFQEALRNVIWSCKALGKGSSSKRGT